MDFQCRRQLAPSNLESIRRRGLDLEAFLEVGYDFKMSAAPGRAAQAVPDCVYFPMVFEPYGNWHPKSRKVLDIFAHTRPRGPASPLTGLWITFWIRLPAPSTQALRECSVRGLLKPISAPRAGPGRLRRRRRPLARPLHPPLRLPPLAPRV